LLLILDDAESLQRGKFNQELLLLRDLLQRRGWKAEIASPPGVSWDGQHLYWQGRKVDFIVNRSTDFLWQAEHFAALRAAYRAREVYVAPNPFTYATRSDKRLLEFLSLPDWDHELCIRPRERAILEAHVPTTYLIREENLEDIASHKEEFFFKPTQSFASRGALTSSQVGRSRLRRLLRKRQAYVAQRRASKSLLKPAENGDVELWTDLRIWAYRGQRFLLSGRASRLPDLLDLRPPGGWLPSYARS